jgi:integrase
VAWQVAGQRRMASFPSYSLAKRHADGLVKDLSKGSQVTALNPTQARDALAAMERLADFYRATDRRVSLLTGISEFVEASAKLNGRNLGEAVEGYLRNVATVKRKGIGEAVTEFLQADAPRTKAVNGQRAQLSADYANHRKIQLRKFADTFPNTAICDLSKEHLDTFIGALDDFAPKTRNHYRAAVRQFLRWAARKDYLAVTHRLGEADGLRPEHANTAEISFYSPRELAALLASANETLRPVLAVGGLAGLRSKELMRLDWADVWRVPGHIEITAGKSKTRQRRLVESARLCRHGLNRIASAPAANSGRVKKEHFWNTTANSAKRRKWRAKPTDCATVFARFTSRCTPTKTRPRNRRVIHRK